MWALSVLGVEFLMDMCVFGYIVWRQDVLEKNRGMGDRLW